MVGLVVVVLVGVRWPEKRVSGEAVRRLWIGMGAAPAGSGERRFVSGPLDGGWVLLTGFQGDG